MVRVPRKKWTVPQLTGVYGIVRVPRNLDCTLLLSRSLLPWLKKVTTQPKFWFYMIRKTLRDDSQTRIWEREKNPDEWKVRCGYLWMLVSWIYLWLVLCSRTLTLTVVDSSFKIEELLHKMAISLKNCRVKEQNHFFLTDWTYWTLSSDYVLGLSDNFA